MTKDEYVQSLRRMARYAVELSNYGLEYVLKTEADTVDPGNSGGPKQQPSEYWLDDKLVACGSEAVAKFHSHSQWKPIHVREVCRHGYSSMI